MALLRTFQTIGNGEMSGYTAVEIMKNCKEDVSPKTVTLPAAVSASPNRLDELIQKDIAENPPTRAKPTPRRYVTLESLRNDQAK